MGELYCDSMWHWDYDLEEDEAREGRPKDNRGWLFLFGGLFSLFLAIPAIAVAPAVAAGAGAAQAAAGAAAAAAAAATAEIASVASVETYASMSTLSPLPSEFWAFIEGSVSAMSLGSSLSS